MLSWRDEIENINKPLFIIGFMGKARSGKDTSADYFCEKYNTTKIAFADSLKKRAMQEFGLTYDQCYGTEKEVVIDKYNKSPREILQLMGTEWYRSIYEDFWVECVFKKIRNEMIRITSGIVISDVRFPNEVELINRLGGKVIEIRRNQEEIKHNIHTSETSLNDTWGDVIIDNDGDKELLYNGLDEVYNVYCSHKVKGK